MKAWLGSQNRIVGSAHSNAIRIPDRRAGSVRPRLAPPRAAAPSPARARATVASPIVKLVHTTVLGSTAARQ